MSRSPGAHVLVVEDNAANQELVALILAKLGLTVDLADNGKMAVEMFESASYDCVLMDCRMPVMDGFEATREIRRRWGSSRPVPIIAMTGQAMPQHRQECLEAGMNDHLAKPFRIASLTTVLGRWLALPDEMSEESPSSSDVTSG